MSNAKRDEVAKVVRKFRAWMKQGDTVCGKRTIARNNSLNRDQVEAFLDQIEAGHRNMMEKATDELGEIGWKLRHKIYELETQLKASGNAPKLRAAVEGIEMLLGAGGDLDRRELAKQCASALSTMPRNCDVGTPDDQVERFVAFCESHPKGCIDCEFFGLPAGWCELQWAQKPYVPTTSADKGGRP